MAKKHKLGGCILEGQMYLCEVCNGNGQYKLSTWDDQFSWCIACQGTGLVSHGETKETT